MWALYAGTILWGMLGTGLALFLVKVTESALDMWWALSGIIGGGMTGLFLLGMISKRAGNTAAIGGVIVVDRWPGGRLPDRWGDTEPGALGIQRRLKGLFDPDGVLNVGVLPGGI